MVEETSDLTGSTLSTSGQYLRAGGGCSSLLIRMKSSPDDEYHHEDVVVVFGVLTNSSGGFLQNNLSDAFMPAICTSEHQVLSARIATCLVRMPEMDFDSAPNGSATSNQARTLNVANKKSTMAKACHKNTVPLQGGSQIANDCCFHSSLTYPTSLDDCISGGCLALHPLPVHAAGYWAYISNADRAMKQIGGCPKSPSPVIKFPKVPFPHFNNDGTGM